MNNSPLNSNHAYRQNDFVNNDEEIYNLSDLPESDKSINHIDFHSQNHERDCDHTLNNNLQSEKTKHIPQDINTYHKRLLNIPLPSYMKWVNTSPPILKIKKKDICINSFELVWSVFCIPLTIIMFYAKNIDWAVLFFIVLMDITAISILVVALKPFFNPIYLLFNAPENKLIVFHNLKTMIPVNTFTLDTVQVTGESRGGHSNHEPIYDIALVEEYVEEHNSLTIVKGFNVNQVDAHIASFQSLLNAYQRR